MPYHTVRVHPEKDLLQKKDQLAWKMAEVATDSVDVDEDVTEMIINRIIDNAAVAVASVNRRPVTTARGQALSHARGQGATVFSFIGWQGFYVIVCALMTLYVVMRWMRGRVSPARPWT